MLIQDISRGNRPCAPTPFLAEVMALTSAVQLAIAVNRRVLLRYASMSAADALRARAANRRHTALLDAVRKVRDVASRTLGVDLELVPGHRGEPGNELADGAAAGVIEEVDAGKIKCPMGFGPLGVPPLLTPGASWGAFVLRERTISVLEGGPSFAEGSGHGGASAEGSQEAEQGIDFTPPRRRARSS